MKKLIAVISAILLILQEGFSLKACDGDAFISDTAKESCIKYGEEYGICPEILMAMIEIESSGNPAAVNGSCKGLMQVSERWHKARMEKLGVTDLYDEDQNIHVAVDYIMEIAEESESITFVLDTYHGDSRAEQNEETGTMSKYARRILERSEALERLHGK